MNQVKDGKFSLEGAMQIAGMGGDPQKPKNVATMEDICSSIVAADRFVLLIIYFGFDFSSINLFVVAVILELRLWNAYTKELRD